MRIAFLSDIHGNLPALAAALRAAERVEADRVVVVGDLVGDGPFPVEVVRELRGREVLAIRGNVDRRVLELGSKRGKLEARLAGKGGKKRNDAWTALRLLDAPEERDWLAGLAAEEGFRAEGREVRVVHGSPLGDTDYIYPSLTAEGLRAKLAPSSGGRPDLLVCGHSHVPFARQIDGVTVINCGSVGRPADGDPRGSLAVAEIEAEAPIRAQILRFGYPFDGVVDAIAARGVPGIDPEEFRRGVKS